MKRNFLTYCLFVSLLLLFNLSINAQGKRSNPPNPHKPPPPHPELPIDGSLSYLLITGIAYGVYQIKKKKT